MDDASVADLAVFFKALADPTRIRISATLAEEELCVHDLAERLGLEQSALSHQLRTMRQLRVVRSRKAGRHVFYRLDDDHVRELFERAVTHLKHS